VLIIHSLRKFIKFEFKVGKSQNILSPENWVNKYSSELYSYAMNKTSKSELAEDLVQETFFAALKSMASFKGLSSERTWLFTILKFKIADYYRKASTKFEFSDTRLGYNDNDSYLDNYFDKDGEWKEHKSTGNWGLDHSANIENKELALALNNCIDKLPSKQKQLILLKLVEEEKTEKVCNELNITPTNYWVIIHRAKLQLRDCMETNWFNK
jgi:RNA polymerase sigma-70 factor (TIGR02943 family)